MDNVSLKPLCLQNLKLVLGWISKPHISTWWDSNLSTAEIENKFKSKVRNNQDNYFVFYLNNTPVGYLQFYKSNSANFPSSVVGIDILIGDTSFLGRGLAKKAIETLIQNNKFFNSYEYLVFDPAPENHKAISALHKSFPVLHSHGLYYVKLNDINNKPSVYFFITSYFYS